MRPKFRGRGLQVKPQARPARSLRRNLLAGSQVSIVFTQSNFPQSCDTSKMRGLLIAGESSCLSHFPWLGRETDHNDGSLPRRYFISFARTMRLFGKKKRLTDYASCAG